jgi:hypothetical protein
MMGNYHVRSLRGEILQSRVPPDVHVVLLCLQDIDITMVMTNAPRSAEAAAAQMATSIATAQAGDVAITLQPKEDEGDGNNSSSSGSASCAGGGPPLSAHDKEQHDSPDLSAMLPQDDAMVYGGEWHRGVHRAFVALLDCDAAEEEHAEKHSVYTCTCMHNQKGGIWSAVTLMPALS